MSDTGPLSARFRSRRSRIAQRIAPAAQAASGTPIPAPIPALAPVDDGQEDCLATGTCEGSATVAAGAVGHATVDPD